MKAFLKLLKTNETIVINTELQQSFHELNKVIDNCCQIALKQPLKDKQMVLMADASFPAACYALMTDEDDPIQKIKSKRKSYAPVAFG